MRDSISAVPRLVAASAAIILAAACGNGSNNVTAPSPQPPISPTSEPVAHLSVAIDSLGSSVAVPGLSDVQFDASKSTGSGALQYVVDYGDGTSATEAVSRHTYQNPGAYRASVTVTDASGRRASASETVTARVVAGTWVAAGFNRIRGHVEVRRLILTTQSGTTLKGEFTEYGHATVPVTGRLERERSIRLNIAGEPEITGTIPSAVFADGATILLNGIGATDGPLPFEAITEQPSGAPPVARLDLQIDSVGSNNAILRYSPIAFSAAQSTGDALRYFIEFGDGAYAKDASVVHPCQRHGLLSTRVVVVDRFGRASDITKQYSCVGLVHAQGVDYSLAYGWVNRIQNPRVGREEFRRIAFESQNAAAVSGFYTHPEGNRSHFTGTLTGDRTIHIVLDDGTIEFTGDVILNDVIHEGYSVDRHLVLRSRGASADGTTLDFRFYDPF